MANLCFYYGTMGCSKTANALMTRFQYLDHQKGVWLVKPAIDNRDDVVLENGTSKTIIKSRIGIQAEAVTIPKYCDILELFISNTCLNSIDVIICDEAQFLTENQVEQLKNIVTSFNIDVLCYGLRTDFKTNLFPGSKRLFELADKIVELDNVCDCGKPAIINARLDKDGMILISGNQIEIGGDDRYKALCWKCYTRKLALRGNSYARRN